MWWHNPNLPVLTFQEKKKNILKNTVIGVGFSSRLKFSFIHLFSLHNPPLQQAPAPPLPRHKQPDVISLGRPPDTTNRLSDSLDQRHCALVTAFAHSRSRASDWCMRDCSHLLQDMWSQQVPLHRVRGAFSSLIFLYLLLQPNLSPSLPCVYQLIKIRELNHALGRVICCIKPNHQHTS